MERLAFLLVGFGLGLYCAKQKGHADKARLEGELQAVRAAMEYQRSQNKRD